MAQPAPTPAELYPIHGVRLRGGRVCHRAKKPADWGDPIQTACGQSGALATGYPRFPPGPCLKCLAVVATYPIPARPKKPGQVTPRDVRRYPEFYIQGAGKAAADASRC
jgi:hypothetical protein